MYSEHMTNRRKIIAGLALSLTLLAACGDDDSGNIVTAEDGRGSYRVTEVTYKGDVYRCIHGQSYGAMWCENVTAGGPR